MHGSDNAVCRRGTSKRLVVALILVLVVLVVLPAAALADTHTWTGIMPGGYWNNALNWSPNAVPTDGDGLVFPDLGIQTATNDAYSLNSVASVDLHGPTVIDSGRAVTLLGALAAFGSPTWTVAETNIGSDLTISETPTGDSDVFAINGALSMNPEGSGGHALTVDVAAPASVQVEGQVSGNPTTCSLTKTGDGELSLSYAAGNTWGGATSVQGGTLTFAGTGALSQTTNVDISPVATVKAGFAVSDVWHNTFTGSGSLNVEAFRLGLTGASAGFAGTTNVEGGGLLFAEGTLGGTADVSAGGTLGGSGSVGDLHLHDAGTLSPGSEITPIGQLTATGGAHFEGGGTFAVDMNNAEGAPGVGFDALRVTGGHPLDIAADAGYQFNIMLRSEAVVLNFDKTKTYSWPIASTNGAITGLHADDCYVDASQFAPDIGGGTFTTAASSDGKILYLVFNPNTGVRITDLTLPLTADLAGWTTTSPMTWSVQAQDALSYPMTLKYRIDGGATTYSASLTTQTGYTDQVAFGSSALEGAHSVDVWVEDDHGSSSPHKTGYFELDSQAPTTGESTSYLTTSSSVWTNAYLASPNGPAFLAASDATSGVASTQYRVKTGSNWGSLTDFSTPITITDENTHEVEFWATDVAGNVSVHKSRYYNLDRTIPTVSETTSYLSASSSVWNSSDLQGAVLQGADTLSGVASVHYRIRSSGAWGSWTTYVSPITLATEGAHDVEFYATDNAGNDSAHATRYYNLDKTNPALTLGTHGAFYNANAVTFTWSATDNLATSGELRYQYKLIAPGQSPASVPYGSETTDLTATFGSAGSPLVEGGYSFYCRVRDNAGNWDTKSFTFVVDRTSPVISGLTSPAAWNSVNYVDFSWTGSDNVDVPGALTYGYRVTKDGSGYVSQTSLGNGNTLRLGSDASPLPQGSYVLYLKVSDQTGNTSVETSRSFAIDRTAPTVAETTSYLTASSSTWKTVDLAAPSGPALLAGSDALSGVASVHFRVKAGSTWGGWLTYSSGITIIDEATHDVEFYATDNAGNDSAHVTKYYNLDKTGPSVSETTNYLTAASSTWKKIDLSAPNGPALLGASDAVSGSPVIKYRIKTGSTWGGWLTYSSGITISDEATHDIEFYATDAAGNDGAHVTKYYNLDKTGPTASETTSYLTSSSSAWSGVNLPGAVLAGSDPLSGVASIHYRVKTATTWGGWLTYSAPVTITDEAAHDVEFYATDNVGNDGAHVTKYYNLDKTGPTASETTSYLTSSSSAWSGVNLPGAVLAGSDPLSGVASIHYRVKTATTWGGWLTYSAPVTITDEAAHDVEFYATDNAGNDGAHVTKYYNLDKTGPTVTTVRPLDGATYAKGSNTTCDWTSTDAASGVASETATVDAQPISRGDRFDTFSSGAHTFAVTATDAAGNQKVVTVHFTIVGLVVNFPAGGETFAQNTTMPVRWTVDPAYASGQFGVWVMNSSGTLLLGKTINVVAGTTDYSTTEALGSTAVGSGYNVRVSYRTASGQPWASTDYSASPFSIAVDSTPPTLVFGSHDANTRADSVTFAWNATDDFSAPSDLRYRYKLVAPGQTESGVAYGAETTALTATYGSAGTPLAEGTYSFYCKVRDAVSNWDTKSFSFVVDRSAPTVSEPTGYLTSSSSAWKNVDLSGATLVGSDALSGVASVSYRVKTGATWGSWTTYAGPLAISDEDTHDVEFYATDNAGNDSAHVTKYYNLDKTGPTVSEPTGYLTSSSSAWKNVDLSGATLVGSDALSGVASVSYRVKTGATWGSWTTYAGPLAISDEDTHDVEFYATDNAGNDSAHVTKYYNLDKTGPTVSEPTGYLTSSSSAWKNVDLSGATLVGSDALSGVASVSYRVKTGATWGSWTTYAGPLAISDEDTHDVEFYATDNAGNDSAHVTKYYNLDRTAPTVALTSPTDGATYEQGSNTTCVWAATDTLSGVSSEVATADDTALSNGDRIDVLPEGAHTFTITATDAAGNARTVSAGFTLTPAPIVVTYPLGGETFAQNTTMPVRWTVATAYSSGQFGVWVMKSSGTLLLSKTINVVAGTTDYSTTEALGSTAVGSGYKVRVSYRRGTGQSWRSTGYSASPFSIAVDSTPPTLVFGSHDANTRADSVTFAWNATDDFSAPSDLRYRYKLVAPGQTESGVAYGAETTALTATYGSAGTPLAEGTYSFYCKVRDAVSNWDTKSFSFVVDRSAPTVSEPTGYLTSSSSAWKNVDLSGATLVGSDALSGVASVSYRVKTGATWGSWTTYAGPLAISDEDTHDVEFYATDNAGNDSAHVTKYYNLDKTGPTVTLARPTNGASFLQGSNTTCDWSTSDTASGMAGEVATVDGQAIIKGARLDTLGTGPHSFGISATDTAGNVRTIAATYTLTAPPILVTGPVGGESFAQYTTMPITWKVSTAYTSGQFGVWVVTPTGSLILSKTVSVTSGATSYSSSVALGTTAVAGGYNVRVSYRTASGQPWTATGYTAVPYSISLGMSVTGYTNGQTFPQYNTLTVNWSVGTAVSTGQFGIWVVDEAGNLLLGQQKDAVAGSTAYTTTRTLSVPAGSGYKVRISYRTTAGQPWSVTSFAPGSFNVISLPTVSVTAPAAGSSYLRSSALPVTWSLSSPVNSGEFGIWVVDGSGALLLGQTMPAVPGSMTYATARTLNVLVGSDYKVRVSYRTASGAAWGVTTYSQGTFTVN